MARAAQLTRPTQTLHDAIRSLEAAALVCLASPKKKPVHQLRTFTRRIQAQMELIAMLPDAPPATKQREKVFRVLKKLRHAAGAVRDLDVELDLIARISGRARGTSRAAIECRKEAHSLRGDLKELRGDKADALVKLLKKLRKDLPFALKNLCGALAPVKETTLSETRLITLVRDWYGRCNPQQRLPVLNDTQTLHAIRKRAKLARYMAESAPDDAARAHRLAAHFAVLQQTGGRWHDWLQLSKTARKELGKSAGLHQRCEARTERALRDYHHQLAKPTFR